jgi:hypothetical protein
MTERLNYIPQEPHYAIIEEIAVYIPGDERSKTNPGHGYPESTEYYTSYTVFMSLQKWEIRIGELIKVNKDFRAIHATPAVVTTTVNVEIKV